MSSHIGVSIQKSGNYCLLVQPPVGLTKSGVVLLQHLPTGQTWECELTLSVLSPHITELGIPDTQLKTLDKESSPAVFNHKFVTDQMIPAVSAGSFTVDESLGESRIVEISYKINAVPCRASIALSRKTSTSVVTQILAHEVSRCYDKITEMRDIGKAHGVEFPADNGPDIETLQKMQAAETRRRQFSAVNPNMRAPKKVAKGFGSKPS